MLDGDVVKAKKTQLMRILILRRLWLANPASRRVLKGWRSGLGAPIESGVIWEIEESLVVLLVPSLKGMKKQQNMCGVLLDQEQTHGLDTSSLPKNDSGLNFCMSAAVASSSPMAWPMASRPGSRIHPTTHGPHHFVETAKCSLGYRLCTKVSSSSL